jgi:hypothetical protein
MKLLALALALATALLPACLANAPTCPLVGTYVNQETSHYTVTFNGMFFVSTSYGDATIYATPDGILHLAITTNATGVFQSNCNVINWSNGQLWLREP